MDDNVAEFEKHLKEDDEMLDRFCKKHLDLLEEYGIDKSYLVLSLRQDMVYFNSVCSALMRSLCERRRILEMLRKAKQ